MIAPLRRPVIAFAGGGTGGHLFPGLAVARALEGIEPVFLVPPDRGDEARLRGEFRAFPLASPRVDRERLLFPARLAVAVRRARRLLRDLRAQAVVGLGGYASVPAALAARSLRLPLYLVEVNAVPGRATRFLARFAHGIGLGASTACTAFPVRARWRVTGTPLRGELRAPADGARFGLEPGLPTLLVLGGSQGAETLNGRILDGLAGCGGLPFQVLHLAGARDEARVAARYGELGLRARVLGFVPDIGEAYAVADLVLGRAGASTVAECAALGKPAVFVPYPWHRDRQQERNARELVRAGAARLVEEDALTPEAVRGLVGELLLDGGARRRMGDAARSVARPDAARAMAAHLLECLGPAVGEARWTAELGG